jgi:pimeloyl-ACP methyl ester carboxylesterase
VLRVPLILALLVAIAALVMPPEVVSKPLTIPRADVQALRHAIFIRGDGYPANLVDDRGKLFDFDSLYTGDRARGQTELKDSISARQEQMVGPDLVRPKALNFSYRAYLHGLFDGLEHSGKHKILLWVHGARNPLGSSPDRTIELVDSLNDKSEYYPICINWQSSDVSSYWAHLTYVRPAHRNWVERGWVAIKAPLVLTHDLARGVARTPLNVYDDISRTWTSVHCDRKPMRCDSDGLVHSRGAATDGGGRYLRAGWSLVTLPVRTVCMAIISAGGPGEWQSFRHSTEEMFQTDHDMRTTDAPLGYAPDHGALAEFMDSLEVHLDGRQNGPESLQFRITLVGHSMGTIVACEMLRHDSDLPIDNIVYMAAACRVHDLFDVVVPFLERPEHQKTRFYDLMLHQCSELDETFVPYAGDFIYRGSLLTWIDDFLDTSESPLDRTLGREENVMPAGHLVPKDVRGRVVLKTFGRNDPAEMKQLNLNHLPMAHGEFSQAHMRFWEQEFWEADPEQRQAMTMGSGRH